MIHRWILQELLTHPEQVKVLRFALKPHLEFFKTLDGHRISIRKVRLKDHYEDTKVIVPGKTLSEVSKILGGDNEKEVLIYFSTNHILFEFDNTIVVSRLIEGEYFRISQMLSSDYETKVSVNKKEFLDCIERATILIRESLNLHSWSRNWSSDVCSSDLAR